MSEKILKFGKSSESLLGIKRSFFEQNDAFLAHQKRLAALYVQQPRRAACMCCAAPIGGRSFTKMGVPYFECARCGHLNGGHVDTDAYNEVVYVGTGDMEYSKLYTADDRAAYDNRRDAIYVPKVDFLVEALRARGERPEQLSYCDVGAGSGYAVAAMLHRGLEHVSGSEISEAQVKFGNAMIGRPLLRVHAPGDTEAVARSLDTDVLLMVGTLEHLQRPRDFLAAVKENARVRYLMISVPLYSPTVFFEMVFQDIMQRQLSGGHTHLYSEASLAYMAKEFAIEPIAEWWFGTDLVDLYRTVLVRLQRDPAVATMADSWAKLFAPIVDEMQLVMDKRKLSSEVHVIYKLR